MNESRRGPGQPTLYRTEYVVQASKLCALGATDEELADFFEVNVLTIHRWKIAHPEFCNALKVAKEVADERVERSLYARATGHTREAVKIFLRPGDEEPVYASYTEYYPPDPTSMIFWLKNRRKDRWRDRQPGEETEATVTIKVEGGLPSINKPDTENT